ncbi:MAG TPA: FlgD immunoglobulin-like domain containing protein [Gaiellaceae bacterium]|nr:FlgD immunoglobulin-like domain containing protein [Gaiellaceae bacterium]
MQRLLTTVTIGGLLIATAAAFAITERLKLTKSAVYGTKVSKRLSPTCGCAHGRVHVVFKLRRRDDITVTVLDARKQEVALLAAQTFPRGLVQLRWNGRTDAGARAPDGLYRVEIHLAGQHQTILLPNQIVLDTTSPGVVSIAPNRQEFSPDGDKQADTVHFSYTLTKPARLLLFFDGARIVKSYHHRLQGGVDWNGKVDGRSLPAGSYTLYAGAVDEFGNSTPVAQRARVHIEIRYIALASARVLASAGSRFEIGVSTDARRYHWKLGARKGVAAGPLLQLRAPSKKGRYTLLVEERGHLSRASVIVR